MNLAAFESSDDAAALSLFNALPKLERQFAAALLRVKPEELKPITWADAVQFLADDKV